jgi:hypothetical protein
LLGHKKVEKKRREKREKKIDDRSNDEMAIMD